MIFLIKVYLFTVYVHLKWSSKLKSNLNIEVQALAWGFVFLHTIHA